LQAQRVLEGDQFLEMMLSTQAEAEAKLGPYDLLPQGKLACVPRPCGPDARADGSGRFPLRCQFSSSVPQVCRVVVELIARLARFMTGLADGARALHLCMEGVPHALTAGAVGDVVRSAVETLLVRSINAHLVAVLASGIGVAPAAQIAVNCGVLAAQHAFFEARIAAARVGRGARLSTAHEFQGTRLRAEDAMFEGISDKIRDFFSIADNLDWCVRGTAATCVGGC
jgi:hypothetical protein